MTENLWGVKCKLCNQKYENHLAHTHHCPVSAIRTSFPKFSPTQVFEPDIKSLARAKARRKAFNPFKI